MDCKAFDEQVARLDRRIADTASQFVLVRLVKITGLDLTHFDFDYDLNFYVFLMHADGTIYGRYGGRDASGAEGRLSLAGLDHALKAALSAHARRPADGSPPARSKPLRVDDYPAAKRQGKNACIHCHQVHEFRREHEKDQGSWDRAEVWRYPLPENVGLTLDVDRGDHVKAVAPGSPADRAGLKPGALLRTINGSAVASIADVMHALHKAPWKCSLPVAWEDAGRKREATLELADGWKKTNITWRPSLLDILPSTTLFGDDLDVARKKALGLAPTRLAFEQETARGDLKAAGMQDGDVVIGVNGAELHMTVRQFLAHLRTNHLAGDRVTLNVVRKGKRLDLPLTLR